MTPNQNHLLPCGGFSLVELMVGLVIGAFILIGGFRVYSSVSQFFVAQVTKLEQTQTKENIISILRGGVDHAGYIGCSYPSPWLNRIDVGDKSRPLGLDFSVYGLSSDSELIDVMGLNKRGSGQIIKGSGALVLQGSQIGSVELDQDYSKNVSSVILPNYFAVKPGDQLLFSDCYTFVRAEVKSVKESKQHVTVYFSQTIPIALSRHMIVSRFQHRVYYTGYTTRKQAGKKVRALYYQDTQGRRQELVDGVSDIRFEYGALDSEGHYIFVAAKNVNDWNRVTNIRVRVFEGDKQIGEPIDLPLERNM